MSTREQMLKARDLIKEKRYDEARDILEQIDHPTAKEWLAKIEGRTSASASTPSRQTTAPSSPSRSPSRAVLLVGLLVVVIVVAIGAVALLSGNQPSDAPAVADNTQSADPTADDSETNTDSGTTEDDAADDDASTTDAGDTQSGAVTGSGMRIPFTVFNALITVELPEGWVCDCAGGGGNLRAADDRGQVIRSELVTLGFDIDSYVGQSLEEILPQEIDEDVTIVSQETLSAGDRSVLYVVVADEDGEQAHHYYVLDSDGHPLVFRVPDSVDEPLALQPAALLIAATAEGDGDDAVAAFNEQTRVAFIAYNAEQMRWRLLDSLSVDHALTVALPPEWAIESGSLGFPMAVKSGSAETSATAITLIPSAFYRSDSPLADIALSFRDAEMETVVSDGSTTVNGREVYFVTTTDSSTNSESAYYFVRDSDDEVVALIIQPGVVDKGALHDDVLQIAGNVEAIPFDYVARLQAAGVIESEGDDGFVPISQAAPGDA